MIKIMDFRDSDSAPILDLLMACFEKETSYRFRGRLELAKDVYSKYYGSPGGREYLKNCIVAKLDGKIVGVIGMQVPGQSEKDVSGYPLLTLIRKAGPFSGIFIKLALRIEEGGERPKDAIYLDFLGTLPKYSRMGIGTMLMEAAEEKTKGLGIKHMALDVWSHNREAIGLYEKQGYRVTKTVSSRIVKLFLGSREYYMMEKWLS
jgi:ribosomal protein S18 acetylase RimI-like enzyme